VETWRALDIFKVEIFEPSLAKTRQSLAEEGKSFQVKIYFKKSRYKAPQSRKIKRPITAKTATSLMVK